MAKKKILIIDDEKDICEFSKSILEKTGKFEVMFSTEVQIGISLVKKYNPDLLLLDILMPDMEGSDVAEYLLKDPVTKNVPVAFLTALAKKADMDSGTGKIGGRFFIPKTIGSDELVSRVESILNELEKARA